MNGQHIYLYYYRIEKKSDEGKKKKKSSLSVLSNCNVLEELYWIMRHVILSIKANSN